MSYDLCFEGSVFHDYLEVATAVVVPRGVGRIPLTSIQCLYYFHILVLHEYWVLMEITILLTLVDIRIVAPSVSSCEQTQNTKSAFSVFLSYKFSLFLKDPFFQIICIIMVQILSNVR